MNRSGVRFGLGVLPTHDVERVEKRGQATIAQGQKSTRVTIARDNSQLLSTAAQGAEQRVRARRGLRALGVLALDRIQISPNGGRRSWRQLVQRFENGKARGNPKLLANRDEVMDGTRERAVEVEDPAAALRQWQRHDCNRLPIGVPSRKRVPGG